MKCRKCGAKLESNVKFCRDCGTRVEPENTERRFCCNCGKPVNADEEICHNCGEMTFVHTNKKSTNEIREETADNKQNINEEPESFPSEETENPDIDNNTFFYSDEENTENEIIEISIPENGIVAKLIAFWNRIDLFCKFVTISFVIAIFLLLLSAILQKRLPIFISIFQISGTTIALLMHKGTIKTAKGWLKYLILIFSFLLTLLNIESYSFEKAADKENKITQPVSINNESYNKTVTPCNVSECVGKDFSSVKSDFQSVGFENISVNTIDDLELSESDKNGIVEAVSINGISDFEGNQEFDSSSKIVITYHSIKKVSAPISSDNAVSTEPEKLKQLFLNAGFVNVSLSEEFDLNPEETDSEFENKVTINNSEDFLIINKFALDSEVKIVTHRAYEIYKLKISVDFIPNLIFSKYNVDFNIDGKTETLIHGKDDSFEYNLKPDVYTVTFCSVDSDSVSGKAEIDLTGDTEVSYRIKCTANYIDIETLSFVNKNAVKEDETMAPISAIDCKNKNYKEIEEQFKSAGFTNISINIIYDISYGTTYVEKVNQITIDGQDDFIKGNIFKKNAELVITYRMPEDDDTNKITETQAATTTGHSASYHSSNNRETAQNGNTGVFAYKNRGGQYSIYYIIDFDEGYVYRFIEGNGDEICDRLKIESGDLNNGIIVTYHDGDDEWSNGLHFYRQKQPEHLILEDNDHFEYDFYGTDLSAALRIRDTKKIIDY